MPRLQMKLAACVAASVLTFVLVQGLGAQARQDETAEDGGDLGVVEIKARADAGATLAPPEVLTNQINVQTIEQRQVEDVRDVGRLDPTIHYNSRTESFAIRGLDNNRILTIIDGIRIPWLQDPARGTVGGVLTFDFNALSSLDIVRGSDSSLYGSGVLGGVVALRTLEPEDLLTDEKNWASVTKGSYDSIDKSWRVDQAFALRAGDTTMLLQGSYAKGKERKNHGTIGGYDAARTKVNPIEFDQNNLMVKIYHNVDNAHRFGLTAERYDYDAQGFDYTVSTTTYRAGSMHDDTERQRERVSLSYDFKGEGFLDEAYAVAYWQKQELVESTHADRLTRPVGFYARRSTIEERSYGLLAQGAKAWDWGSVGHQMRFGVDARRSDYSQFAGGQDNCPPPPYLNPFDSCWFLHVNQSDAPDTKSNVFGFVLEDEMAFFDNRLRVTPGVRFDYFKHAPQRSSNYERNIGFTGVYPASRHDERLSPKLRFELDAGKNWTLYAQWAQGFRAPTVPELYQFYINPGRYYLRGNPDLKPEISNGFDVGALFGDYDFGGSVSFFANRYKNFIDTRDLGPGGGFTLFRQEYINRAKVHISGIEAKGHWQFHQNWRIEAGLSYAQGKDIVRDEYLNSVPPFKAVVGLEYTQENWGGDARLTAVSKRDNVETGSHDLLRTPGYGLVDISAWWQPIGEKGPRLQAGVYNLFDKKYWDAVSLPANPSRSGQDYAYYTEPGRSFKFSIIQKF